MTSQIKQSTKNSAITSEYILIVDSQMATDWNKCVTTAFIDTLLEILLQLISSIQL